MVKPVEIVSVVFLDVYVVLIMKLVIGFSSNDKKSDDENDMEEEKRWWRAHIIILIYDE